MVNLHTVTVRGKIYIEVSSVCALLEGFGEGESVETVNRLDELIFTIKNLKK